MKQNTILPPIETETTQPHEVNYKFKPVDESRDMVGLFWFIPSAIRTGQLVRLNPKIVTKQ